MSIASLLSIKVTSPITHMVSSAVRGVAASMLGVWLFHDVISTYVHPLLPAQSVVASSSPIFQGLVGDRHLEVTLRTGQTYHELSQVLSVTSTFTNAQGRLVTTVDAPSVITITSTSTGEGGGFVYSTHVVANPTGFGGSGAISEKG